VRFARNFVPEKDPRPIPEPHTTALTTPKIMSMSATRSLLAPYTKIVSPPDCDLDSFKELYYRWQWTVDNGGFDVRDGIDVLETLNQMIEYSEFLEGKVLVQVSPSPSGVTVKDAEAICWQHSHCIQQDIIKRRVKIEEDLLKQSDSLSQLAADQEEEIADLKSDLQFSSSEKTALEDALKQQHRREVNDAKDRESRRKRRSTPEVTRNEARNERCVSWLLSPPKTFPSPIDTFSLECTVTP
jgi:hypothetical protein